MDQLHNPQTLKETLSILRDTQGAVIAGGTDLIPQGHKGRTLPRDLINLTRIKELSFVRKSARQIDIGSCTTMTAIVNSPLLRKEAPALVQACTLIGSVQTRNRATLGGNVANASPAGDTLPPLLIHDAQVALVSAAAGERLIPLDEYIRGPGQTHQRPGEIIHYLRVPTLPPGLKSAFRRVGNRSGMAVSVASTAVGLQLHEGTTRTIEDLRIALGAVAPSATRVPAAEKALLGQALTQDHLERIGVIAGERSSPIEDVRASKRYRQHITKKLVIRTLQQLSQGPDQEEE